MEMLAALDLAHGEFDRTLRQVGDDQWALPTPCTEWTVYQVTNHVLGAGAYFMALMEGASKEDALGLLGQDYLQPDPDLGVQCAAAPAPSDVLGTWCC